MAKSKKPKAKMPPKGMMTGKEKFMAMIESKKKGKKKSKK